MAARREWVVWADVVQVHDGDTFTCNIDLGWGLWRMDTKGNRCRVRLVNASAPELTMMVASGVGKVPNPKGIASKEYLTSLIEGKTVKLISKGFDQYGRTLALVLLNYMDVGAAVIGAGHAVPYDRVLATLIA